MTDWLIAKPRKYIGPDLKIKLKEFKIIGRVVELVMNT